VPIDTAFLLILYTLFGQQLDIPIPGLDVQILALCRPVCRLSWSLVSIAVIWVKCCWKLSQELKWKIVSFLA